MFPLCCRRRTICFEPKADSPTYCVRGRHSRLEYEFAGSGGVQYFQQDGSLFFPVSVGVTLPAQDFYRSQTHTDRTTMPLCGSIIEQGRM
jgi:hypothetical protein